MGDETDILDSLVAGGIAVVALAYIGGAVLAATAGGYALFATPYVLLGIVFLSVAFGILRRTPLAWRIGMALFGLAVAWSLLAILLSRQMPSGTDLANLLAEAGIIAYLVVRRKRFRADRTATVTAPPGAGPSA